MGIPGHPVRGIPGNSWGATKMANIGTGARGAPTIFETRGGRGGL